MVFYSSYLIFQFIPDQTKFYMQQQLVQRIEYSTAMFSLAEGREVANAWRL